LIRGARELRMMRPTVILVNTSRGPVLDEPALAEALAERVLECDGLVGQPILAASRLSSRLGRAGKRVRRQNCPTPHTFS